MADKIKKTMRHKSALKAHRQAVTHQAHNYQIRSRVRTLTTQVLEAISQKNVEAAKKGFIAAQSAWAKAVKRGVFHKNAAARKMSRIASRLATLSKA